MDRDRAAGVGRTDPVLVLALLLGALLRLWNVGGYEFWADEIHSQLLVESRWSDLFNPVFMAPYTPLYFAIAKLFFGDFASLHFPFIAAEGAIRILPVFFGLAMIVVLHRMMEARGDRRGARAAALLAATNPLLVYFSREHRMYALYIFVIVLLLSLAHRLRERPDRSGRLLMAILACAAFLAFPYAPLYMPALFVLAWRRDSPWGSIWPYLPMIALAACWEGCIFASASAVENAYYGWFNLDLAGNVFKNFAVGNFAMTHAHLARIAYAVVPATFALCAVAARRMGFGRESLFWALFAAVPFFAIWTLQFRMGAIYNYKSFLPSVLIVVVLVAIGLSQLPRSIGLLATTLLVTAYLYVDAAQLDRSQTYNWTTPRDIRYRSTVAAAAGAAPDLDGLFASDQIVTLEAMLYGGLSGKSVYFDRSEYLLAFPALNRPCLAALADRHGLRDVSARPAGSLPLLMPVVPSASWAPPPNSAMRTDTPIKGTSVIIFR